MIGSMSSAAWKAWRIFFDAIRPFLVVRHRGDPAIRLDHARVDAAQALDAVVLVLLDLLGEVVLPRLDPRQAHRHVGNGKEENLVHVRRPLAPVAVRRLRASAVVLEPGELDVAVGLVLDEAVRAGADIVLDRSVAGRLDHLLRMNGRARIGPAEAEEERAGGLLQVKDDGEGILGLDRLDVLPERLARRRDLPPAIERGDDVCRRHLLAIVELDPAAERDGVAPSPVAHGVALGEERDRAIALVVRVERLVDMPDDLLRDHGGRRL